MDIPKNHEINQLDELLKMDVVELKAQIEENQLIYGLNNKDPSSIYTPKDPEFYLKKRRLKLKRQIDGQCTHTGKIVADTIKLEIECCEKFEYRDKSLLLLVYQYFKNRMKVLVNMKRSQMLRYKRYCINKTLTEFIKEHYNARLNAINTEYNDVRARYNRLKAAQEGFICNSDQGLEEITMDDIFIYMKWLIQHMYNMEYITTMVKIIRWIPIKYRKNNAAKAENDTDSFNKSESTYKYIRSTTSILQNRESSLTARHSQRTISNTRSDINLSAASGGGYAVDERNLLFPLHTNDMHYLEHLLIYFCEVYGINMDVHKIRNAADEMELYSVVSRRFKTVFNMQEQMRTFKVYDKIDSSQERWGMDSAMRALLKPANWKPFNKFTPKINLLEARYLNKLRDEEIKDEFLITASLFLKKSNAEETQMNLRHHALVIQHLPVVYNTAVVTNPKGFDIADILKTIYTKCDVNLRTFTTDDKPNNDSSGDHDNYNFTEALQLLGLDESIETKDDSSTVQGAYLSYLHLRFLKIRDMQRTCLSILNYFRSVERTLVIDEYQFTKESVRPVKKSNPASSQDLDSSNFDNLGNHGYLQATVDDFKISIEDFMKTNEIENHDDFYLHENGRIHVQDLMGNWIMYDVALKDFEKLESDLILIGSYYITFDKEMRSSTLFNRKQSQSEHTEGSEFYILEYGHREVDRFGVLYDLWCQHTDFMEQKKKLFDLNMEVYNTVCKQEDRQHLAQTLINLMHHKPRIDLHSKYFLISYRYENMILERKFQIFKMILDKEISREREYLSKVYKDSDYPYRHIPHLLIAPNSDECALQEVHFLEFLPSLSQVCQINKMIDYASLNIKNLSSNTPVTSMLKKELDLLDTIYKEISEYEDITRQFTDPNLIKFLSQDSVICNPLIMEEIGRKYLKIIDSKNTRGEKKRRKIRCINEFSRLIELANIRFRLIHVLHETEYLHSIYDNQAITLGYDNFHLFMRQVPFERAVKTEGAEYYKPFLYVSSVQDDDSVVDKYRPEHPYPAIHELDNVHFGLFNLITINDIIQCLESKGLENLQVMLKVQFCHKNAVASGVLLCDYCRPSVYKSHKEKSLSHIESSLGQTVTTYNLPISAQSGPTPLALDSSRASIHALTDSYPEALFSLQLEKVPIRDKMLNNFLKKFPSPSTVSQVDMEKAKRDCITFFTNAFYDRIAHIALKAQIIAYYNSIINTLNAVPEIVSEFFQFGKAFNPAKSTVDANCNLDKNPKKLHNRCRKVIDDDGQKLINIWYIPHFSEILFLYRQTEDAKANLILYNFLRLVMAFHDIIQYVVGFWKFGFNSTRVPEKMKMKINKIYNLPTDTNSQNIVHHLHCDEVADLSYFTDYNTTNTYQLRKEFVDLEIQIEHLPNPYDLEQVIDLLNIRRKYHFYYFEICATLLLKELFLSTDNIHCYKKLMNGIQSSIPTIRNVRYTKHISEGLCIPSLISETDPEIDKLFPWRSMMLKSGPVFINFDCTMNICDYLQLCFICIPQKYRFLIYNQFYNLNLSLEDMLVEQETMTTNPSINNDNEKFLLSKKMHKKEKKEGHQHLATEHVKKDDLESTIIEEKKSLSLRENPIQTYEHLLTFLYVLRQLYVLRDIYSFKVSQIKKIDSYESFLTVSKQYKLSILFPVLRKLSYDINVPNFYFYGPLKAEDVVTYPKGIPEVSIYNLLIKALINKIEKQQINLLRSKITQKIDHVIKQRHYESETIDMEKSPYLIFKNSLKNPNLVADLIKKFEAPFQLAEKKEEEKAEGTKENESEDGKENEKEIENDNLVYSKMYVNKCLQYLANTLLRIHRETYESFAMYFENLLKHQQQLLLFRNREYYGLKEEFHEKEQSLSVERQFILANKVSERILEINYLRGKVKEDKQNIQNKENTLRRQTSLSFKFLIRNLYNLGFEQMTRIKVSRFKLHCDVYQRINATRLNAFYEMNKIKERSGAKYTTDDEIALRNLILTKKMSDARAVNFSLFQFIARMKSLFNWIYNYTVCDWENMLNENMNRTDRVKGLVFLVTVNAQQKVKLIKCEFKRLKVIISDTEKELSELKNTLNKEITQQTQKRQKAKLKHLSLKKTTIQKQKQISDLMNQLQEMNGQIATMKMKFESHIKNNKSVTVTSHNQVEKLSTILTDERRKKLNAFNKVDDLIAQVYEFEAGFAMVNTQSEASRGRVEKNYKARLLQTKTKKVDLRGNYPDLILHQRQLTYDAIIKRHCIPYTPCHFLPFRRDRVEAHRMKMRIQNRLIKKEPDSKVHSLPKLRKTGNLVKFQKN